MCPEISSGQSDTPWFGILLSRPGINFKRDIFVLGARGGGLTSFKTQHGFIDENLLYLLKWVNSYEFGRLIVDGLMDQQCTDGHYIVGRGRGIFRSKRSGSYSGRLGSQWVFVPIPPST